MLRESERKESLEIREKAHKRKVPASRKEGTMCPWGPVSALDLILVSKRSLYKTHTSLLTQDQAREPQTDSLYRLLVERIVKPPVMGSDI